jgi:hypothetical protein
VAVIAVPANHMGVSSYLQKRNEESAARNEESIFSNQEIEFQNFVSTHHLFEGDNDLIVRRLQECGLGGADSSNINVLFVPSYLNGGDGVFNENYFDFLQALKILMHRD